MTHYTDRLQQCANYITLSPCLWLLFFDWQKPTSPWITLSSPKEMNTDSQLLQTCVLVPNDVTATHRSSDLVRNWRCSDARRRMFCFRITSSFCGLAGDAWMLEDVASVLLLWMFFILYIDSVPSSVVSGIPYCRRIVTWRVWPLKVTKTKNKDRGRVVIVLNGRVAYTVEPSARGLIKLWHCYIETLIVAVHRCK